MVKSASPPPPLKLLLVDDRRDNLLALQVVLENPEYQLLCATSGKEALALLEVHPDVALVLLDIQMPGMDGFEVAKRIKEKAEIRHIPIIFITAVFNEDPYVRQGYEAGAIDYFTKPYDPEVLRLKVKIYASFRQRELLLRERENRIRQSEEILKTGRKLSAVLQALPVGVIIADVEGRICQTNDAVLRILKSVERLESDSYGEFLRWWEGDGRFLKLHGGPLMRALRGQVSHNEITEIRCFDGSAKSIFTSASPLRDRENSIVGAVLVVQDVTEHKNIESALEKRIMGLITLGVELERETGPQGN